MEYSHYEEVPRPVQEKIVAEAQAREAGRSLLRTG